MSAHRLESAVPQGTPKTGRFLHQDLIIAANLPRPLKNALFVFLSFCDGGETCFPGDNKLKAALGIEDRQLSNIKRDLKARGILSQFQNGQGVRSYRIHWHRLREHSEGDESEGLNGNLLQFPTPENGNPLPEICNSLPNDMQSITAGSAIDCKEIGNSFPDTSYKGKEKTEERTNRKHAHACDSDSLVWPKEITRKDLEDASRVDELFRIAVAKRWVVNSEDERLGFHAASIESLPVTKRNPGGLFVSLILAKAWTMPSGESGAISAASDEAARKRLRKLDGIDRDSPRERCRPDTPPPDVPLPEQTREFPPVMPSDLKNPEGIYDRLTKQGWFSDSNGNRADLYRLASSAHTVRDFQFLVRKHPWDRPADGAPDPLPTPEASDEITPANPKTQPTTDEEWIERIWQAYPKRIKPVESREAIRDSLKKALPEYLLERTKCYARAVRKWDDDRRNYIPSPKTWFDGECWEEDQAIWHKKETRTASGRRIITGAVYDPDRAERTF